MAESLAETQVRMHLERECASVFKALLEMLRDVLLPGWRAELD